MLFGVYIVQNHGEDWTGLPWTLPLIAVLVPIVDLVVAAASWYEPRKGVPSIVNGPWTARALVLQVACWSFLVAAIEIGAHLLVAQSEAEFDGAFWVALLLIIGMANLLPYLLTVLIWRAAIYEQGCWSASSIWLMPELALGVGLLFFLGPPALHHSPPPRHPRPLHPSLSLSEQARVYSLVPPA